MGNNTKEKNFPNKAFWDIEFPKMLEYLKKNGDRIDEIVGRPDSLVGIIFKGLYKVMMGGQTNQLQKLSYDITLLCLELDMIRAQEKHEKKNIIIPKVDLGNLKIH